MEIENGQDVQRIIDGLIDSTWAYSALGAAVEIGLLDALHAGSTPAEAAARTGITNDLARALLDVLTSLGLARREDERYLAASGLSEFLQTLDREDLLAWLRSTHFQARAMYDAARHGNLQPGWIHTDPEILQAQGRTGRGMMHVLATQVFPRMPGLIDRLHSPDASFLDIGMGVGIISIELCRMYTNLRAVGLEPGAAQAQEARRNIAEAGLEDRIAIRPQRLEELRDKSAFDLVYFPQIFMPYAIIEDGLRAVYESLRPGGWVLVVAITAQGGDLHATMTRLLNIMWGGGALSADDVAAMTRAAGFESVMVGGAPGSLIQGITARRPPSN